MTATSILDVLEELITTVVEPAAADVDGNGTFPRSAVTALGRAGVLGLLSGSEVGGAGGTLDDAARVVRRLAASCGSTAMVVCMHYCATAAIEQHGPEATRRAIAAGTHLTTLAFSETGSRSHFWAPLGTASVDGDEVVLDASKSWVTSAGEADSYVWSSRPVSGDAGASLWLVPSGTAALEVAAPFDGLGLRGNASSPVNGTGVRIPVSNRLGEDGAGLNIALGVVLPVFQVLSASFSLGLMDAALYAQATAAQWDPATAVDWTQPIVHNRRVEAAVVQVMTFLVENEEAALVVPARFLGQIHPHFREIQQFLAVTVADVARHIEVFTRRATMTGHDLALSTVGGRTSLQTLLDEPDFAIASFLLSVMGEGTFVSLLSFLERHAPDPVARRVAHLARNDEARHGAFSLAQLAQHLQVKPDVRRRLALAVERRHRALQHTSGLNEDVFDALVLLAGGDDTADAVRAGWHRVQDLRAEMDEARAARLIRLGFSPGEAETLSSLHTRNFT